MPDGTCALTNTSRLRPIMWILGAATLFGTTGTVLANGPLGVDPVSAGVVRLLVGGAGLAIFSYRHFRQVLGQFWLTGLGAVGVGAYQLCFFYSTRHAGVAVATVITIGSSPLFARLIGALRHRPPPHRLWYLAALILSVGLAFLSSAQDADSQVELVGVISALVAGLSYAIYTECAAVLIDQKLDSTAVMGVLFLSAGILTSPFLLFRPVSWIATQRGVVMIVYLGIVTLSLAYVAFGKGLKKLVPTTVVMLTLLEPVVATLLAYFVLHEKVSGPTWFGTVLVLVGLPIIAISVQRPTTVKS
ncbi:MAG: EamA family transporter [Ilumatobacteraceae bacterium]|jgi:drug/metabolite transporter, DME family|nr:EamA family transporter [Ilumatobacteraceae bacterium]MDP4937075.1 EamA family transporter [Ilumatobacteraceae bacterium]